jgi:hypothetical protein
MERPDRQRLRHYRLINLERGNDIQRALQHRIVGWGLFRRAVAALLPTQYFNLDLSRLTVLLVQVRARALVNERLHSFSLLNWKICRLSAIDMSTGKSVYSWEQRTTLVKRFRNGNTQNLAAW